MSTIRTRLYPLHIVNEHDIINWYSHLSGTGFAGQLVKLVTGSVNPSNMDGWSSSSVGTNVAGTFSNRYEGKARFTPTVSGDNRYNAVGLTLLSTLEFDENSQPLRYNEQRAKEIGAVVSGETVPIAMKGVFGVWGNFIDTSLGNVQPGNLVVVSRSGNGLLGSVDPTNATNFNTGSSSFIYTPAHVVGKWLTSLPTVTNTGLAADFSAQGGYALFTLNCVV